MLFLLDEYTYQTTDHLFCKSTPLPSIDNEEAVLTPQSGQSLIEHSYKADSDLSPAGWEYAERLKAAVTARRKAVRTEKADKAEVVQEENPLIVSSAVHDEDKADE
jgi:hypothetical protein